MASASCSEKDLLWLKNLIANAPMQNTSSLQAHALKKYLELNAIKYTPSLDLQTCVFIAYQTAVVMATMNQLTVDNIATYGRVLTNLFQSNTTFKKVVPKWFTNLAEQCTKKTITNAADIVEEFKKHGADHKLSYCKIRQGIPLLITEHADCTELNIIEASDRKEDVWMTTESDEIPEGVPELDRTKLRIITNNFISRASSVVATVERYRKESTEKNVIVYRVTGTGDASIKDIPLACKYLNLLMRLEPDYINPVLGIFETEPGKSPCIVLECDSATSLFQYLVDANVFKKYLTWHKKLRIARDIARGLQYLHKEGVVHKMLSPFTVMINPDLSIKLTSFGMEGTNQTTATSGGNRANMAPELRGSNATKAYSSASDVFDFGLILMELAGYRVHTKSDFGDILAMSATTCPRWYQHLVVLCTKDNREERPSIDDILLELQKHLDDRLLDAPRDSLALMELDKEKLKQAAIINNLSDDISNIYGGTYDGMKVLIKRPNDTPKNKNVIPIDHLLNELVISSRVQSQNIINQYGVIDCNTSSPVVVTSNVELGSLHDYISRIEDKNTFTDSIKLHIAISIAQGLVDLHDLDYVHCNVSTRCVFLCSNRQVKLGDLTLAQAEGMLLSDVLFEYVHCLDPEVKTGSPFSKAADVYAFGKLLIALDLCEQESGDEMAPSSVWCKELVQLCCDAEPKKRPTMAKIVRMLKGYKTDAAVNFAGVKLRGAIDVTEQLKSLPSIEVKNLVYHEVFANGAFGKIQKGIYNGEPVAIKVFDGNTKTDPAKAAIFVREARLLDLCKESDHVVKFLGVCADERQIVMELMESDVGQFIQSHAKEPEKLAWKLRTDIALQMSQCLAELHALGVVHLDIKSFNYLYSFTKEGKIIVKLADFGQAHIIKEEWDVTNNSNEVANLGTVGTAGWKAPELLRNAVYVQQLTKVDIYALGVIFYELDAVRLPHIDGMECKIFERKTMERDLKLQVSPSCPFQTLANKCLLAEPLRRPNAEILVGGLQKELANIHSIYLAQSPQSHFNEVGFAYHLPIDFEMGNAASTKSDLEWFEQITARAPKETSAYLEDKALIKYFHVNARQENSPSLDVQTCVFIAYRTAKAMASIHKLAAKDIVAYGCACANLFEVLQSNTTFPKVVPQWLTTLIEQCKGGAISSATDIVKAFNVNGMNHNLHYCKIHQGIPVVISQHAECKELQQCQRACTTTTWKPFELDTNIDGVPKLERSSIHHLTDNFIARTSHVVITREKYEGKQVIAYRLINAQFPSGSTLRDVPEMCSYINLRLRLQSEFINSVRGVIDRGSINEPPCLIMNNDTNTSLYQYLVDANTFKQYMSWTKKILIAQKIATGLKYLHDNGVVHKMLSPFTVLLSNNLSVKLACFGLEGVEQTTGTSGGNWANLAPEVRSRTNKQFSRASDVFDFGSILMELAGYRVHNKDDYDKILTMSCTTCPGWYQQLVILCTKDDPLERPSIDEILKELDKNLNDCLLDIPRNSLALMELDKEKLKQAAIVSNLSNDISNVYGGVYDDMDILIKRPNDTPKNKNITPMNHLYNEIVISTRAQSQNIVNLYGVIDSNTSSPAVIVANMHLGNLHDYISRIEDKNTFTDSIKLHIAISIAQGIADLHELDYVHCNVSTRSVFLSSNRQVKLGDLTLAQPESMLLSDVLFEYVHCLAPEVKAGCPFSKAADVYAFGKLLIALDLCEQESGDEMVPSSVWCSELVELCCDADPKKRLAMVKIVRMLKSFRGDNAVDFSGVKLRGAIDVSEELKEIHDIKSEELNYGDVIGSGAYGNIQKGIYNGVDVAIKVFKAEFQFDSDKAAEFAREAKHLFRCQNSEYVVKLFGVCVEKRYLIMELMEGDIGQYIQKKLSKSGEFLWKERTDIALQMSHAIAFLHSTSMVHLDIKSFNFLYKFVEGRFQVKIADFGQTRIIDEEWSNQTGANEVADLRTVGTVGWKAPELINKSVYVQLIKKVDIYALGVIFYELETLQLPKPPNNEVTSQMHERNVLYREFRLQLTDACPFKDIGNKCFYSEPARRPLADKLVADLQKTMDLFP